MKCTIFISIDSKVFTPASHPQDWLLVKAELEQAADTFCQARLHLGGVHWVSTIYCLSFRRHLSTQHPLYDFFKYHCEGTVPHISLSWPALSLPGSAGHQLFSIGHEGFIRLSTEEYNERNYDKLLFSKLIKVGVKYYQPIYEKLKNLMLYKCSWYREQLICNKRIKIISILD